MATSAEHCLSLYMVLLQKEFPYLFVSPLLSAGITPVCLDRQSAGLSHCNSLISCIITRFYLHSPGEASNFTDGESSRLGVPQHHIQNLWLAQDLNPHLIKPVQLVTDYSTVLSAQDDSWSNRSAALNVTLYSFHPRIGEEGALGTTIKVSSEQSL